MSKQDSNKNGAGKGDKPRNCFSLKFKDNYDAIDWGKKNTDGKSNQNNSNFLSLDDLTKDTTPLFDINEHINQYLNKL